VGSIEHSRLPAPVVEELVRMADRVTRRTS